MRFIYAYWQLFFFHTSILNLFINPTFRDLKIILSALLSSHDQLHRESDTYLGTSPEPMSGPHLTVFHGLRITYFNLGLNTLLQKKRGYPTGHTQGI